MRLLWANRTQVEGCMLLIVCVCVESDMGLQKVLCVGVAVERRSLREDSMVLPKFVVHVWWCGGVYVEKQERRI